MEPNEWMRGRLERFLALIDDACAESTAYGTQGPVWLELERREPTVRLIVQQIAPALTDFRSVTSGFTKESAAAARYTLGVLEDAEEVAQYLEPQGPKLAASLFHPWVWDAARAFWDDGHYAVALQQAWKAVNLQLQLKVGRPDLSDDGVVRLAWSPVDPKPGETRLRPPGDRTTQTWKNQLRGALHLGQACTAGIRNVVAHEHEPDITEAAALEQLATLSLFARWTDAAVVDTAP